MRKRLPRSGGKLLALPLPPFVVLTPSSVVWELIKQIGQNLTSGTSLTSITLPINISEPRSYLEMVADGWCYAPLFLKQASVEPDPVERMKMVITFAVAGLSNTCVVKKPFNPIVGMLLSLSAWKNN